MYHDLKGEGDIVFFFGIISFVGSVFIIEGSGGLNQDALATSQAEFPGI